MITINDSISTVTESQLSELQRFSTSVLSDAFDTVTAELHTRKSASTAKTTHFNSTIDPSLWIVTNQSTMHQRGGCLPATIRPVTTPNTTMVGIVTTVHAPNGTSLPLHLAMATHSNNRILVVSTEEHTDCAFIGDIQATMTKLNGCKGIILDGYVRDVDGITKTNLPVYCTGTLPKRPSKQEIGGINIPIYIGNVAIHNGDIVIADRDGILIIPPYLVDDILLAAEKKESSDNKRLEKVRCFDYNRAHSATDFINIMTKDVVEYVKRNL